MANILTIAELAERKAELLDELSTVNAEIASRAGEVDESGASEGELSANPPEVETATDKTVETVQTATSPTAPA